MKSLKTSTNITKTIIYVVCIFLSILSIFPFWLMFVNATRSTYQIQQNSVGLFPSTFLLSNWKILNGKSFNAAVGFMNSMLVSSGATLCAVYFSSLTAYALVAYTWKLPAVLLLHPGDHDDPGPGYRHWFLPDDV
jgi:multiple sugar transport system permease protein